MDAAAAALLAALSSPSSQAGLHSRFAAYLQPFTPHLSTSNPNPKPQPKRATKQNKQQPPPPDAAALRPLAKRFLPFLARALQLLPPLVRTSPGSGDAGGGCPDELLEIYGLLLDCLAAISPCLAGKPYSVLLQRGRFVCCLESRGHFARAELEAADTLDALRSALSPPASTKSRRGAPSAASILPDPGTVGEAGTDTEVTTLVVELTVCLAHCASKGKVKEAAPYERVLSLVELLQPWLRILADDVSRKYLTLLVNAMSRCTFFLVAESSIFNADLVHGFCVSTLEGCVKAQMIDRLPAVARKICSSVDLSWGGSTRLLLDVLKIATDSVVCLKADLPKAGNEFLVFVAYVSRCFLSANRDACVGASELLYKQGGYFSEVSSPTASVLLLYAAGLYFSTQHTESDERSCISADFLNNEKYLQALNEALGTLARFFGVISCLEKDSSSLMHQGHSNKKHSYSQPHENISFVAYLDSLEFVCKVLLQHANAVWKNFSEGKAIGYSGNIAYILTTLHQFIDSSLTAYSCTKMSEGDKERLHEHRGTLLKVLVSAMKISFVTNKAVKKSLSSINCAISSTWLTLEELKFFISSLGNIGVTLYNIRRFEEAPKVLELCCQTIWANVRHSYHRQSAATEGNEIIDDLPKDKLKDVIVDAFTRIAKMVDVLHRCGAKITCEIVARSLSELLADGDMPEYHNSSLALIKLWVKITHKDFEGDQDVDGAPLLYHSLLDYPSPLPKKLVGLIVEQELLAYGLMESRGTTFCAKMQMRIIDILLGEIYCAKFFCLERSRVLVRKAGALRASGVQNISSCLESLSEAISLLRNILDSSQGNATVINQLAIAHCLQAHCAQEGNLGDKVIFDNAESALDLWSKVGTFDHSPPGMILQQPSETIVPLLCSLVDLLAMKGCFELQFKLCKLMIMIWKEENLPLENIFSLLFTNGHLSHACCHLPMDQQIVANLAQHLGADCHRTEFWRNIFKGDRPSLFMFLQRMLPIDLVFSESCEHSIGRQFSFNVSVDEVNKAASSLVSEVSSSDQSTFIASCLYYGLSERLFSGGQLFQAFSYGKEALHLRKKLLKKKFKIGSGASQCCGWQGFVSLEAWGSTIAEIWPDFTRSTSMKDSFLTTWNVLRCYLESTLQVAMMHGLIGNGAEAEVLLRTGKEISHLYRLPVFQIAFTSLLGQLYRKRELWDEAESELKHARDLLAENDAFISCKLCRLTLEVSVDMQVGDLFWSLFEKDFQKQSTGNLSSALGMYQSAMEKFNSTELEFLAEPYDSFKTGCVVCNKDCIAETKCEACKHGKEPLVAEDDVLPPCIFCVLLRQASIDHCNEPAVLNSQRKNSRNAEAGPPLDAKVKRTTRNPSRLAKEKNVESHAKTRTRSSRRIAQAKGEKVLTELSCKNGISWSHELSADALVSEKTSCSLDGINCSKDNICNMFGCWDCLLVKSLNSGCIQNILQFRWNCVRRRYLVSLLLKIARALGAHGGNYGAHEVHSVYWQCISLLYFRSLPQGCYRSYGPHLIGLIMNGNTGDFLSLERAEILYSMSFFLLKGFLSEQSRDVCCHFSSVELSDVVPWLLKAFVLSRESPSLFQEVCRLLACIFLLSTVDSSIQLPLFSEGSALSLDHWAAYFHQISVGTYLNCHYLASLQVLPKEMVPKGSLADSRDVADEGVSKFLRFPSADIEHIEKHITEFFHKLPDVPIVCISMLGDDYVNVLGETLLLPSFFPAWILLSRFDSTNKPTTMLLPVDAILEELQPEGSCIKDLGNPMSVSDKKWQCPWGFSITDHVAPTFRSILEENFMSLSSATLTINDVQANHVRWWSHRMKLNNYLDKILKDMEESWLGPWKCLLLGHQLADQHIEAASSSIITGLEKEFKLEVNPALIKTILGGAASVDEVHECLYQLILYKGYFGRGECCGKDRFRCFSSRQIDDEALETLKCLIENAANELPESVDRDPVILVLDINVQMLPWENLPVLRNQEIYRMPSVGNIFLALTRGNNHYKDGSVIAPPFPVIDPFNTFYLLNPSGDLSSTQEQFDQLFRNYEWKGKAGDSPTAEELVLALTNHDLFLYFGHGSGTQYVSAKEIEKLNNCAAALLMGCSSGTLHCKGGYAPRGAPLSYLFAGSPAVIANLWDVSDKDIDRFSKALLDSWLQENFADGKNCSQCCQLTQEFESMNIAAKENGRTRRKGTRGKKSLQINDSNKCCSCSQRRIASYLSEARRACRLPLLIGASPVCYGVPTVIKKK
ncbi:separase [Phragmites australis]|uniref:separase n=1 Tax=Phragmites australis TaxID=29695 RepID=UPI002D76590C|nr:separase [Phragmites australis]